MAQMVMQPKHIIIIQEQSDMAKTPKPKLKTPTDLGSNSIATVADALNGILADSFALYFKTKNFHWHVSGPHFRDYHLLFDDQAAQIFATTDLIAERIRKTGNTTLRSVGDIARHQTSKDNDLEFVSPADMLAELRDDNLKLVESLRVAKDLADEAKDNATSGIVDTWTDEAEQRAWFLFEAAQTV
jgi:starvation-inducible DNA-binding protein